MGFLFWFFWKKKRDGFFSSFGGVGVGFAVKDVFAKKNGVFFWCLWIKRPISLSIDLV